MVVVAPVEEEGVEEVADSEEMMAVEGVEGDTGIAEAGNPYRSINTL